MPKAKSNKINKSAWIREQPASMSANDVVAKAKTAGIKLTTAQVYTVRSNANKSGGRGKPNGKRGRPKGSLKAAVSGDFSSIRRAVFQHGFARADAFLAELKRGVGL